MFVIGLCGRVVVLFNVSIGVNFVVRYGVLEFEVLIGVGVGLRFFRFCVE